MLNKTELEDAFAHSSTLILEPNADSLKAVQQLADALNVDFDFDEETGGLIVVEALDMIDSIDELELAVNCINPYILKEGYISLINGATFAAVIYFIPGETPQLITPCSVKAKFEAPNGKLEVSLYDEQDDV